MDKIRNYKLLNYAFIFVINLVNAQDFDKLILKYKIEKEKENILVLEKTKEKSNLKWLNLLPNISYNMSTKSANIGISLNSFARFKQSKNRNNINRENLANNLQVRLDLKITQLQNDLDLLRLDSLILIEKIKGISLYNELFQLKKDMYKNNKIDLESWLNVQISEKKYRSNLENYSEKYEIKKRRLLRKVAF